MTVNDYFICKLEDFYSLSPSYKKKQHQTLDIDKSLLIRRCKYCRSMRQVKKAQQLLQECLVARPKVTIFLFNWPYKLKLFSFFVFLKCRNSFSLIEIVKRNKCSKGYKLLKGEKNKEYKQVKLNNDWRWGRVKVHMKYEGRKSEVPRSNPIGKSVLVRAWGFLVILSRRSQVRTLG